MKVKKFRIRPRIPTVGKLLKAILGVKQLAPEVEQTLPTECDQILNHILPTAFYQTWSHDELPASFKAPLQAAGLSKSIAVSALVATIGAEAEDYLSTSLMSGETLRSQVITAVSEECADLSFQFLLRLLADDAKSDDCDLAEPIFIIEGPLLSETLSLLESENEGVLLDSAQHLTPRFTRVALVAWWPISKKKRPPLPAKKKTA